MRIRRHIAGALLTMLLASGASAATNTIIRPPSPDAVLDDRFDDTGPIDLSVTHELFFEPITERLDVLEEARLERYLWTTVPKGRMIVFPDDHLRPIAATMLSDAQYRTWDRLTGKRSISYLDTIASKAMRAGLPSQLRNRKISWRTGYADKFVQALDRATPYIPYLERMAVARGLPRDTWVLAIQESLFRPEAISTAWCEGPFQLSRPIAREFGLIIPPMEKGGNATYVNETRHPLLAAQAAFDAFSAFAYHAGGFYPGMSAYHAGPGNLAQMRKLQLRYPDWQFHDDARVAQFLKERYSSESIASLFDPVSQKNDVSRAGLSTIAADVLSWIVTDGWRHPRNNTTYKQDSAQYVPRFLALREGLRRDRLYTTERKIVGTRHVLAGQDTCGPRGPFTSDVPLCWETIPVFRDVERYSHATVDLDIVTMRYQRSAPGKNQVTGEQLARAFGDTQVFLAYNPHIPLKARIPDGTRVALPAGAAASFSEQVSQRGRIQVSSTVEYRSGEIAPLASRPDPLPEDLAYARFALLRSAGKYSEVTRDKICALSRRMQELDDGSWFRTQQQRASQQDCALMRHRTAQSLIDSANGKH